MNNEMTESIYYLTSFPRSGNTWLRFLIANVYNTTDKNFKEVDFYNIHKIIPEYKTGAEKKHFKDLPGIFKTHNCYQSNFKRSILLLRDPFDTLYSYQDFLEKNRDISLTMEELVQHETYGVQAVIAHAESYIKQCENLLILTYETLHESPWQQLEKIFDFINVTITKEIIDESIRLSSFQSMSRSEEEKGRQFGNPRFKHIRNGQMGEGRREIMKNPAIYRYILSQLKKSPILNLLYN